MSSCNQQPTSVPEILFRKVTGADPDLFHPQFSSVVPPLWKGEALAIVGTGPSLKGFDFASLRGLCRVLAVKEAMHDLPFADAVFGLDIPWMRARNAELAQAAARGQEIILALPDQATFPETNVQGAKYVRRSRVHDAMSDDPERVEAGAHSGFAALNIAYHRRPALVVLFGYDYTAGHYNEQKYAERNGGSLWARYAERWAANYKGVHKQFANRSIRVINANPDSNLSEFPKVAHGQAFECLRRLGSSRD